MAITAQQCIDRALRVLGQLPSGESPSSDQSDEGLEALNAMIGAWLADRDIGLVTLTTFATLATSQSLPNGYDEALVYNLAIRLAPEYETKASEEIVQVAVRALQLIRRAEAPAIAETAQKIINKALRVIGHLGPDEISTAKESAYALDSLNSLIGTWRLERLMVWSLQEETLPLFSGDGSYTIGPSGDVNTTRPVAIDNAWIEQDGITYPVRILTEEEYAAIGQKGLSGEWPESILYRATIPAGTILTYPVANATRTMKLVTRVVLSTFAAVSTSISLPPGYERALVYNLAMELAPEYGKTLTPEAREIARESKAAIKRANTKPLRVRSEVADLVSRRSRNIYADE